MNSFADSLLMWILAAVLPACALAAAAFYVTSRPLRREERARFLLELIESALAQGQSAESYIASLAQTRDKSLGVNFYLLGAYLQQGCSLAIALEKVPGFGPPQLTAMLRVGESLGDYGRVLPACREMLRDSLSESRALINYQAGFAFILNPLLAAGLWFVGLKIVPVFKSILGMLSVNDIRPLEFLMRVMPWLCILQMALVLALYSFSVLMLGGPRFLSWLESSLAPLADRLWLRVPWRRKRLQCDFSAMLSLLLDASLPEDQAIALAARGTANAGFITLGLEAVERLRAGQNLAEALHCFDETGEFRWRLKNAGRGGGRFFQALNGWHEWLHARACQQEQAAAQTISTGLLLLNGASVALVALLAIGSLAHITNSYMGHLK
ncbi:MAG TPA: type II secretion system F family protein [Verrucomicrobiae bacterium]|jgi:type II secretory pathway component PulF